MVDRYYVATGLSLHPLGQYVSHLSLCLQTLALAERVMGIPWHLRSESLDAEIPLVGSMFESHAPLEGRCHPTSQLQQV